MHKWMCIMLVLFSALQSSAEPVKVQGEVRSRDGKPVVNASVRLAIANISSITDEDGLFGLYGQISPVVMQKRASGGVRATIKGQEIEIWTAKSRDDGNLQIFTADGKLIHSAHNLKINAGSTNIRLPETVLSTSKMYLIRFTAGEQIFAIRFITGKGHVIKPLMSLSESTSKDALLTVRDTLIISHSSYATIHIPLTSYQWQSNLMMDTARVRNVDTSITITEQQIIDIAQRWKMRGLENMTSADSMFTQSDIKLAELTSGDSMKARAARSMSSVAMILMGKNVGYDQAITYASEAVLMAPKDVQCLNNFGALLRDRDSLQLSLTVLLYGRKAAPWAPAILANLGNTLFELGDDKKAEGVFLNALRENPGYGPAHKSLGILYFGRGELLKAAEHMLKAANFAFGPSVKSIMEGVKANGGGMQSPPGAGSGYDPSSTQRPDQSSVPLYGRLVTPDFPNWAGIDQMCAAYEGLVRFEDSTMAKGLQVVADALQLGETVMNSDAATKNRFVNISNYNQRAVTQLTYLGEYYSDRHKENQDRYTQQMKPIDEALQNALDEISATADIKLAAWEASCSPSTAAECLEQWAQITKESGQKQVQAYDNWFMKWRQVAKEAYEADRILVEEFWIYSEPYINSIFDDQGFVFTQAEMLRRQTPYTILGVHASSWKFGAMALCMGYATAKSLAEIEVPDFDPAPEPQASVPQKEKGPPCPFQNGTKLKVSVIVASVSVDCESIEVEGGEGIIVGGKYNFKNKSTELTIAAGVKASLGAEPVGTDIEVGASSGMTVTFDKNGQPTDFGFKTSVSGTARVANQTLVGLSAESTVAVSGISYKTAAENAVFQNSTPW